MCQQRQQEPAGIRTAKLATEQFDGVEYCRFAYETDGFRDSALAVCLLGTWVARNWHLEELPSSAFNCAGVVTSVRPAGTSLASPEMKSVAFLAARDDVSGTPHAGCMFQRLPIS